MDRRRALAAWLAALFFLLTACGAKEDVPPETCAAAPVTLVQATDLHYISPTICDNGAAFHTLVEHSDGKAMFYIQEILETLPFWGPRPATRIW